ncbi:MAG: hypothetical protein WDM85_03040 [Caulobacteraceae bacterium]
MFERSAEELDRNNRLSVAVNISGRTITSGDFIEKVISLVKAKKSWAGG